MKNILLLFIFGYLFNNNAFSSTTSSATTTAGNWNDSSTWENGEIPTSNDSVVVTPGFTLYVDPKAICMGYTMIMGAYSRLIFVDAENQKAELSIGKDILMKEGSQIIMNAGKSNVTFSITCGGKIDMSEGKSELKINITNSSPTINIDIYSLESAGSYANKTNIQITSGPATITFNTRSITIKSYDEFIVKSTAPSATITLNVTGAGEKSILKVGAPYGLFKVELNGENNYLNGEINNIFIEGGSSGVDNAEFKILNPVYSSTVTFQSLQSITGNGNLIIRGSDPGAATKPDPVNTRNIKLYAQPTNSYILFSGYVDIRNTAFYNFGIDGTQQTRTDGKDGITFSDIDGAKAVGLFFYNNEVNGGFTGLHLKNCKRINNWYSNGISSSIIRDCDDYGIYFDNTEKSLVEYCKIYNIGGGIIADGIFFENSKENTIRYNDIYNNTIHGIFLKGSNYNLVENNLIHDQVQISGEEGLYLYNSQKNVIIFNKFYNNPVHGLALEYGSNQNYIAKNNCFGNANGGFRTRYNSDNNIFLTNISTGNQRAGYTSHSSIQNLLVDEILNKNSWGDVYIEGEENKGYKSQIWLKNCLLDSTTEFTNTKEKQEFTHPDSWVISEKHDNTSGLVRIWGNFSMPQSWLTNSLKWNYLDQLWDLITMSWSATKIPQRRYDDLGQHAITSVTTSSTTKTEIWIVSFDSNQNRWQVRGTQSGVQKNILIPDTDYISDNGEVRFRLTHQAEGPEKAEDYVFLTIAPSGDNNVQKKIDLSDFSDPNYIGATFTNDSGATIEIVGTETTPTIITRKLAEDLPRTTFYYGINFGGTINKLENVIFEYVNSTGVVFNSAPLSNSKNLILRNFESKPGSRFIEASGITHTYDNIYIDTVTISATYNVTATNSNLTFRDFIKPALADNLKSSVVNWDPVLSWSGLVGFSSDGIEPNHANPGEKREFQIKYTDFGITTKGNPPTTVQVWIDLNDNGFYEQNEKFGMSPKEGVGNDSDYTNSEIYVYTSTTIGYAGDGFISYRFYSENPYSLTLGTTTNSTLGTPFSTSTLTNTYFAWGEPILSSTFSIKGSPPRVTIQTPQGEQFGEVIINYYIIDDDNRTYPNNLCNVKVEYSKDGVIWSTATPTSTSEATTDLVSSSGTGSFHYFIWDTKNDLPLQDLSVKMRITPTDMDGTGSPTESSPFYVDNIRAEKLVFISKSQDIPFGTTSQVIIVEAQTTGGIKDNDANYLLELFSTSTNYHFLKEFENVKITSIAMSNGEARFRYVDNYIGNPTISVKEYPSTIGVVDAYQTWIINSGGVSVTRSSVTVNVNSLSVGNTVTVTITLYDSFYQSVIGKKVSISASGSDNKITQPSFTTDNNGQTLAYLYSTKAETKNITATDETDGLILQTSATVVFTADVVDKSVSRIFASQTTNIPADGKTSITITVTLLDKYSNPVSGKNVTVSVSPSRTNDILVQPQTSSNASGQVTATLASNTAETKTITATDTTDNILLSTSVAVTFVSVSTLPTGQQDSEKVFKETLSVYPNPAKKTPVLFNYKLVNDAKITIRIYNILGELVFEEVYNETAGENKIHQWNLINQSSNKVASGVYICKIIVEEVGEGGGGKKYEKTKKVIIVQ